MISYHRGVEGSISLLVVSHAYLMFGRTLRGVMVHVQMLEMEDLVLAKAKRISTVRGNLLLSV